MSAMENLNVVYQPNETVRLDVRLENGTVWLTQARLGVLFGVDRTVVNRHIHNIYKTGELEEAATCTKIAQVQNEGGRTITRTVPFYNLDMLAKRGRGVSIELVTHSNGELEKSDFEAFAAQCGKFTKTTCSICHDCFIIVDQKEIYWTGASLKDAGRLTVAAAKMGAEVIPGLLESIRKATTEWREYGKGKNTAGASIVKARV